MVEAPRRVGRPFDEASAITRARQISVLAVPLNLRVLSAFAGATGEDGTIEDAAVALGVDAGGVASAAAALVAGGLLSASGAGFQLTADAWVRFGRLMAGDSGETPGFEYAVRTQREVPDVVSRIADDLAYRFSAHFSPETVAKYVADSYWLLAERSRVDRFLPSLTARFTSDRLGALATSQGIVLRGTPEVLFVCVQNAGRSQMAAAILRHLAGERVHVRTAGSSPASAVNQDVIDVLDEVGIGIAAEFPKPLTDEVVRAADYVVTMGCGDACPIYPGRRYMDWSIDDPVGMPIEEIRRVRDEIVERVQRLIAEMRLT